MVKPHALQGKQRTAPHASQVPLRILLIDSHRIAAIVEVRVVHRSGISTPVAICDKMWREKREAVIELNDE